MKPFPFRLLVAVAALGLFLPTTARSQAPAPITTEELEAFEPRAIGPAVTGGRIHDVTAHPDDPSTLWVATASGGLWKSTNRGHSWTNTFDSMKVSTFGDVALAPSDRDVVYAGTGEQQNRQSTSWGNGVYRSDDGGESWRHLGLEETRHIARIRIHPDDPDVAYVAAQGNLWRGSEERGVYRTTDGGDTWEKVLAGENEWTGAVDLVMSPENPDVLNALIETADDASTGTYRTTDAGESWEQMSDHDPRPMYYSHVFIDPTDEDVVYSLARDAMRSTDGGATWTSVSARPTYDVGVHSDHHTMWIDPDDPEHYYLAGDAGLHETYDWGENYRKVNNFPIGQFYAIGVDMRDPYRVYGGMQDNHSWMGPSRTRHWIGIVDDDWSQIGFGDGMYWQIDPTSHRFAYGNSQNGGYVRLDAETGDRLSIEPIEPEGEEYRFDWVSPSLVSQHDPKRVIVGGNRIFISRNQGESWTRTPDLSTGTDRDTLELMGVEGADIEISANDGTSSYAEATTIAESPLDAKILWVGFDDGNLQLSRDGGRSWTELSDNVDGVPDGTYVSRVVASASARGTAYATFDAHRDGDFAPYVFRTTDFGRTWEPLHGGLPSGSVNVLVEHPDNTDVLFLGTEHALFVSTDAGESWAKMPNLPTTAYDDLVVHPREKDLVMGTHGRSIWILDDTRPLARWNDDVASGPLHLFPVRSATIFHYWKDTSYRGTDEFHGRNPDDGALITYRIGADAGGDAIMTVQAPDGRTVRRMEVPSSPGVHRVNWDLRHGEPMDSVEVWQPQGTGDLPRRVDPEGPFVVPGEYSVTVEAGGERAVRTVDVRLDPAMADRVTMTQLRDREAFLVDLMELSNRLESARNEAEEGSERADSLRTLQFRAGRLYGALAGGGVQQGSLYPPTEEHLDAKARLEARASELLASGM